MTRKRYIKLLMSCGCDRNTANVFSGRPRLFNLPYAKAITGDMQYCTFITKGLGAKMRGGRWYSAVFPLALKHLARTNAPLYHRTVQTVSIDEMRKEIHIATHANAPFPGPVTLRIGTAGGGGHE